MKQEKINITAKVSNIFTGFILLILLVIRIISDYVYFYSETNSLVIFKSFNVITSFIFLASLSYFLFKNKTYIQRKLQNFENTGKNLLIVLLFLLSVTLVYSLITSKDFKAFLPDFATLLLYSLIALLMLVLTGLLISFLVKRYFFLRQKNKRNLSYFIALTLILAFFISILNYLFPIKYLIIDSNNDSAISGVFFLILFILGWLVSGKNTSIYELSGREKFRYIVLYGLCGLSSFYISGLTLSSNEQMAGILNGFLLGSNIIISGINLIFAAHCFRYILSIFVTLPLGPALRQKTTEINSLIYLNKIVAESINKDHNYIFEVTAKLAWVSTRAAATWIEIYDCGNDYKIVATQNITENMIERLHKSRVLLNESRIIDNPIHYGNISKHKPFSEVFEKTQFQDLIIVPIYSLNHRIGTLYNLHINDYGFEASDLNLLKAFSYSLKLALENQDLLKESLEKERLKEELILAQKMQINILPQKMPYIEGYDIAALSTPAVEVGGDYYDVVKLANKNYCVLAADVSGKGMSAAFYVAQLKGMILSSAPFCNSPSELLKKINSSLYSKIDKKSFITMTAIEIEHDNNNVKIARAGHTPILICNKQKTTPFIPKGLGLGLMSSNVFDPALEELSVPFSEGSVCLMVSDGIIEQRNNDFVELGLNRLINMLDSNQFDNAQSILDEIQSLSTKFAQGNEPHDDRTIIAITRK